MGMSKRQDGRPVWVGADGSAPLRRIDLRTSTSSGYNEAWIQRLIDEYPDVLPLQQIEPSLGGAVAVCRELPLAFGAGRTGALDNVLVTSTGGLVLIETKLWRNPEARRAVVAQAMEYAAAIFRLSYEEFESAILAARRATGEDTRSLFELISADSELDEAAFVDAVTRNLTRGRAVVAVVGDGIREDILPIAELLQAHAGLRFTFALIELGVFETPQQDKLIIPSILAQTTLIERGVVSIREQITGGLAIEFAPPAKGVAGARPRVSRAISLGEDEFYELLDQRQPGIAEQLRAFLDKAAQLGIYTDRQSGLNLKHESTEGPPLNLGTIRKDGFVDTGPSTWWGRTGDGLRYNEQLAAAIGGSVSSIKGGQEAALRTSAGKTPLLSNLLPAHADVWLSAMRDYILVQTSEGAS